MAGKHTPDEFTATRFVSAKLKADITDGIISFMAAGFPRKRFTRDMYHDICVLFGSPDHFDKDDFYRSYLSTPELQCEWAEMAVHYAETARAATRSGPGWTSRRHSPRT